MTISDQHQFTIQYLEAKLNKIQEDNIELLNKINLIVKELTNYLVLLKIDHTKFIKLSSEKVKDLYILKPNKFISDSQRKLFYLLKEYIKPLKQYENNLKELSFYSTVLYKVKSSKRYAKTINTINHEITKYTLMYGTYSFGYKLSSIFIRERKILEENKRTNSQIDWDSTTKLKKELLESGKELYSKDNTTGHKYIVYYDNTYDYWWNWHIYFCKLPNRKYFTFVPTSFNNVQRIEKGNKLYVGEKSRDKFIEKCTTKEDILNCDYIGSSQKLLWLIIFDPLHVINYSKNV